MSKNLAEMLHNFVPNIINNSEKFQYTKSRRLIASFVTIPLILASLFAGKNCYKIWLGPKSRSYSHKYTMVNKRILFLFQITTKVINLVSEEGMNHIRYVIYLESYETGRGIHRRANNGSPYRI